MLYKYLNIGLPSLILLLTKIWAAFAGLVISYLIVDKFTLEMQGYFYAFNSLLLLQVFVDLGMSTIIVSFVSHERVSIQNYLLENSNSDKTESIQKLVNLFRYIARWYAFSAIAYLFLLIFCGYYLFMINHVGEQDLASEWLYPWLALVFLSVINFLILPLWPIIEGMGYVAISYIGRLVISITSSIGVMCSIYFGIGLWALSVGAFLSSIIGVISAYKLRKLFFIKFIKNKVKNSHEYNWGAEMFPMQWKIALSWVSGYLIFSAFVPIVFYFKGAEVAGKMGLSIALLTGIMGLCASIASPAASKFSEYIAANRYEELDIYFDKILKQTATLTLVMFGALYLAVYYGNFVNSKYTLRIISLDAFFWLVIAGIFSSLAAPVGIYLRSHKREPLMALSLVGGFLSLMIIVIFAKYDSIENLTKWYSMLIICLSVFTFCIKRKFKEARN